VFGLWRLFLRRCTGELVFEEAQKVPKTEQRDDHFVHCRPIGDDSDALPAPMLFAAYCPKLTINTCTDQETAEELADGGAAYTTVTRSLELVVVLGVFVTPIVLNDGAPVMQTVPDEVLHEPEVVRRVLIPQHNQVLGFGLGQAVAGLSAEECFFGVEVVRMDAEATNGDLHILHGGVASGHGEPFVVFTMSNLQTIQHTGWTRQIYYSVKERFQEQNSTETKRKYSTNITLCQYFITILFLY